MHQKPIDVAGSLFTVLVAGEGSVMAVMGPERRSERKKRPCQPTVFLFLSSNILLFFISFGFYLAPQYASGFGFGFLFLTSHLIKQCERDYERDHQEAVPSEPQSSRLVRALSHGREAIGNEGVQL